MNAEGERKSQDSEILRRNDFGPENASSDLTEGHICLRFHPTISNYL